MMNEKTVIVNAKIVTEQGVIEGGALVLSGGKIESVGPAPAPGSTDHVIDAQGAWALPGFIDVHVHGGYGADWMDGNAEAFDTITRFHGGHGTTSIVATTMTAPKDHLSRVLAAVHEYRSQPMPYAQVVGVHLEGPFINVKYKGAQNPAYIVPPQPDWLKEWTAAFPGLIRQLSLAPETEGALGLIAWAREQGINVAAAHTDATYDQIVTAADAGLNQAVHTFNAMTPLHHRNPGTAGAVMTDDRIAAEVIADGHHVHPAGIEMLIRAKGPRGVILITDAMAAAGMPDGEYDLGGLSVIMQDGVARLRDSGNLAGSTLTMIDAFRFVVRKAGVSVADASRMASLNPARQIGVDRVTGSLAPGKQADVLLLDAGLGLRRVWIKGQELAP